MTVTTALRNAKNRPALGDRTKSHLNVSVNPKGKENSVALPVKPPKPVLVVTEEAVPTTINTITTNPASTGKGKTVVEQDKDNEQPTKMKRVDVSQGSGWDDVASTTEKNATTTDDGRANIVSPIYPDENFDDEDDVTIVEEQAPAKLPVVYELTGETEFVTSETNDHTRVTANGYAFSRAFLEKSGREVIRPLEGESVDDAITKMRGMVLNAMVSDGKEYKSILEDNDKYNLANSTSIRSKVTYKCLYVLAVLDVVKDTLSLDLPPTIIKSCELGRSKAIQWIGVNKADNVWIPHTYTIYGWFRDFINGRFFRHPDRKLHLQFKSQDRLNDYFERNPTKKQTLKAHIQAVLKVQRSNLAESDGTLMARDGTLDGNAYDFYWYFVDHLLREESGKKTSQAKRDVNESEKAPSAQAYAKSLAENRDRLASFGFEELTWVHFSIWTKNNFGDLRGISDPE